jgi:diaminohydroxyphosphoribosylaminopyrimidine deaminase/5-amino-6-(5-phosphoribosylamino)uracil reductase
VTDDVHMAHALALGRRGLGRVWPNPAVGCVIVKDGRILGRGWTQPGGRPHAEAMALAQAGAGAAGATAFVTLEPCAHDSPRGPACADLLADAGLARVVTAMADPDPRTAGRGHARLRAAGIAVDSGVGEGAARADHAGFLLRVTARRPFLTLKLAASLDGRIATATGESRWITGPAARRRVHALRACHDAVLVGGGTARADDPLLTVRGFGPVAQPVRVVLSAGLSLPDDGALAGSAAEAPLWIVHGPGADPGRRAAWAARGARLIEVAAGGAGLDPAAVLAALADAGLTRVLCEGGGRLAASLLRAGLVDALAVFSAGVAIGAEGRPMLGDLGLSRLGDGPRFVLAGVEAVGGDVLSRWTRA